MAERISPQSEAPRIPGDIQKKRQELATELLGIRQQRNTLRTEARSLKNRLLGQSGKLHDKADQLALDAREQLTIGKQKIADAWKRYEHELSELDGFTTDHSLIQFLYRKTNQGEAHPVATDSFLDKSKGEYNAAWLSRELIQNFVDHNPVRPGTLDGVEFSREQLPDGRTERFTINGRWSFEDPTGVISPHSDKPSDVNTAGGNGIGLKQAAIRLMRDFDVQKFQIQGEGWTANYSLAKSDVINRELTRLGQTKRQVRHDWLVANLQSSPNRGQNSYTIETDNQELIDALAQLENLGVSERNPYLQDVDFSNEYGAIKWLPQKEGEPQHGRLFLNGQVMNYQTKGETSTDYWKGPDSVTLRLNNVDYAMNIDRPPVSNFQLGRYVRPLIESMNTEQVIDQIKRSEPIWSGGPQPHGSAAEQVIEELVRNLRYKYNPTPEETEKLHALAQYFEERRYLAQASGTRITEQQRKDLESQGYRICQGFFAPLGMPSVETRLSNYETATMQSADTFRGQRKLTELAQETGIPVSANELDDRIIGKDFAAYILEQSRAFGGTIVADPTDANKIRIMLDPSIKLPEELLSRPFLPGKNDAQRLINTIRAIAFHGLRRYQLEKVNFSQGKFVNNFDTHYDDALGEYTLYSRSVKAPIPGPPFVEITFTKDNAHLRELFIANPEQSAQEQTYLPRPNFEINEQPDNLAPQASETFQQAEQHQPTPDQIEDFYPSDRVIGPENNQTDDAARSSSGRTFGAEIPFDHTPDQNGATQEFPKLHEDPEEIKTTIEPVIVEKRHNLSNEDLDKLDKLIPGIKEKLIELNLSIKPSEGANQRAFGFEVEQYIAWRDSKDRDRVLQDQAGYLEPKKLVEIVQEYRQAQIAARSESIVSDPESQAASREVNNLRKLLAEVVKKTSPEGEIKDFEIIYNPEKRQLAQLGVLRTFIRFATGADASNELFIYEGSGSKGINIGKEAIGLHRSLLDQNFYEAYSTFTHEVAHNDYMDHEVAWRETMQALFVAGMDQLTETAQKLQNGDTLEAHEMALLDLVRQWDVLRPQTNR